MQNSNVIVYKYILIGMWPHVVSRASVMAHVQAVLMQQKRFGLQNLKHARCEGSQTLFLTPILLSSSWPSQFALGYCFSFILLL